MIVSFYCQTLLSMFSKIGFYFYNLNIHIGNLRYADPSFVFVILNKACICIYNLSYDHIAGRNLVYCPASSLDVHQEHYSYEAKPLVTTNILEYCVSS